jgi:hypothetical protein
MRSARGLYNEYEASCSSVPEVLQFEVVLSLFQMRSECSDSFNSVNNSRGRSTQADKELGLGAGRKKGVSREDFKCNYKAVRAL